MANLNAVFKLVKLSSLPAPKGGSVLEIPSSCSVLEAAKLLERHDVLSAPVFDDTAPKVGRYILTSYRKIHVVLSLLTVFLPLLLQMQLEISKNYTVDTVRLLTKGLFMESEISWYYRPH